MGTLRSDDGSRFGGLRTSLPSFKLVLMRGSVGGQNRDIELTVKRSQSVAEKARKLRAETVLASRQGSRQGSRVVTAEQHTEKWAPRDESNMISVKQNHFTPTATKVLQIQVRQPTAIKRQQRCSYKPSSASNSSSNSPTSPSSPGTCSKGSPHCPKTSWDGWL